MSSSKKQSTDVVPSSSIPRDSGQFDHFVNSLVHPPKALSKHEHKDEDSFVPGWSGNGSRGRFRQVILPSVLRDNLTSDHGVAQPQYCGSYSRRTTISVSDIDIHIHTEQPVTRATVRSVAAGLEAGCRKNTKVSIGQHAINVEIPRPGRAPDVYDVVFRNKTFGSRLDRVHYPSLVGTSDRTTMDETLNKFYHNNKGAQNVSRFIKYQTYGTTNCLKGIQVEQLVRKVAEEQGHTKNWCIKNQGELYRHVVDELSKGRDSNILNDMIKDARAYDKQTKSALKHPQNQVRKCTDVP